MIGEKISFCVEKGRLWMKRTRTWMITSCSTGIGRGIAEAVLQRGENAVVTAREKSRVEDLEERYPGRASAASLDMERPETIAQTVRLAQERFGRIDVLVNNVGHGYRAAVEEGEPAAVAELFQTNFFGPVELMKLVLPGMQAGKYGVIVNVSSIGAVVPGLGGQRVLWGVQGGALIVEAVDMVQPPLRVLLGSDAVRFVTAQRKAQLEEAQAQAEFAARSDY